MIGFFASLILLGIAVLVSLFTGLIGLAPKNPSIICLQQQVIFDHMSTMWTVSGIEIREPVWKEQCLQSIDAPAKGQKLTTYP